MPSRRAITAASMTATVALLGAVALAAPAQAASDSTWDRLAQCESGGNWSINTGNGFYGGVQFTVGSWRAVGGQKFAAYPHHASRAEQIWAAERLLDIQGWGAWPACSARLGLGSAQAGGTPDSVLRLLGKSGKATTVLTKRRDLVVNAGRDVSSMFVLKKSDGRRIGNARVALCVKQHGKDVRCKNQRTNASGEVVHRLQGADRQAKVWTRYSGSSSTKASKSGRRSIAVAAALDVVQRRLPKPEAASTAAAPKHELLVDVEPNRADVRHTVAVQAKSPNGWKRVAAGLTQGREELADFEVGDGRYRVRVLAKNGLRASVSDVIVLR